MMNERRALYRQLQHYFEGPLFGIYRWGQVKHRDPEPVKIERDNRGRRINELSLGRFVERAVIDFDGYTLSISSPNEKPPGGEILLLDGRDEIVKGTICDATWGRITTVLKANIEKGCSR